jgi:hypothetical protein
VCQSKNNVPVLLEHSHIQDVPGHSGITYNEKSDKQAGEATVFWDLVHEPDDVIKEMEARLNEQENAVPQELWSVQRLIERGWSRGDGRKSVDNGWERSLVNQVELGVLSRSTLRRLIEEEDQGISQRHYSFVDDW